MKNAADDFRVVLVMAGGEDEAAKIAQALVEERLAACVNIVGPARSVYRWRGAVESASEYLLVIKCRARHFPALQRRIGELHSYEVPEIIAVQITDGSKAYLQWLAESTAPPVMPHRPPSRRAGTPSRPLRSKQ
jgi:periplasmic divalent cation tolerance protein